MAQKTTDPDQEAGDDDRPLPAGWVERRAAPDLAQLGQDVRPIRFADIGDVRLIQELRGEWGRLDRNRLFRRGFFSADI